MTNTKPYPGIPAGILDEDLEKYLSKKKRGPFDAALIYLPDIDDCRPAIRLLEAAGKVDKERALWNLDEAFSEGRDHVLMMAPYKQDHNLEEYNRAEKEITALLEGLPDSEERK